MSKQDESFRLDENTITSTDDKELVSKATSEDALVSHAALWLILLLRLTTVTTDERLELRNSKLTFSFFFIHAQRTQWTKNNLPVICTFKDREDLFFDLSGVLHETMIK